MPARHLWSHIQKQMRGRTEEDQLRILRQHLDELHDEWKGPYKDLRDRLRRQVSRLEGHEAVRSRSGQADPFHVKRQGDARVCLAGVANAGKSSLVAALTDAAVTVADYPFATTHPVPGMLPCEGGVLQLIDTPPVVIGLAQGQGPGRPLLHLFGGADLILAVVNLSTNPGDQLALVFDELAEACVLPIPGPLSTQLRMRGKGGIRLLGHGLERQEEEEVRSMLRQAHIEHAEVTVRTAYDGQLLQRQVDGDQPLPTIVIGTHSDMAVAEAADLGELWPEARILRVNEQEPVSPDSVCPLLLAALGYVQVALLKRPSRDAEAQTLLLPMASDIAHVADRAAVPAKRLKGARVWGASVPRPGQAVKLDHVIEGSDRVYLQA